MGGGKVVGRCVPGGSVTRTYDATADDSDKTFTVPANKLWKVKWILARFVTTATVGNRGLEVQIGDGTNIIGYIGNGGVQAASTTTNSMFYNGAPNTATGSNRTIGTPPDMLLPAGYTIRIWDTAAIDAAADDLTVAICVEEFDV